MSIYARLILVAIGCGYRRRVPRDQTAASLVDSFSDNRDRAYPLYVVREAIGPLPPSDVSELLGSGLLHKLTRDGEGSRTGWLALGLDGAKADFYCMVQ